MLLPSIQTQFWYGASRGWGEYANAPPFHPVLPSHCKAEKDNISVANNIIAAF